MNDDGEKLDHLKFMPYAVIYIISFFMVELYLEK